MMYMRDCNQSQNQEVYENKITISSETATSAKLQENSTVHLSTATSVTSHLTIQSRIKPINCQNLLIYFFVILMVKKYYKNQTKLYILALIPI